MRAFIAVDLEGVGGYVKWDTAHRRRERMDGRTVAFTADDYLQAFEMLSPLHYLAGFPHA